MPQKRKAGRPKKKKSELGRSINISVTPAIYAALKDHGDGLAGRGLRLVAEEWFTQSQTK